MIVGLGFKAKVGKDEIAKYLVKCHNFKRIGFADSLKEACRNIFGFTDEQLFGELKEVIDPYWGFTPRFAMQKVGTECMRDVFDKDIWIKSVENKVLSEPETNWIITDVRFPNEAAAIERWDGFLVKVNRPLLSGASGGIAAHPSEIAMENFEGWDYTLHNTINVHAALYDEVEHMLDFLKQRS